MNKDRILEIASAIDQHQDLYDHMRFGEIDCGTPGCIAGWSAHLFGGMGVNAMIGLNDHHSDTLCGFGWPLWWLGRFCHGEPKAVMRSVSRFDYDRFDPTPQQAVEGLRWIAFLGYVPPRDNPHA